MPRMPKYLKREWAFFLDERGRKKYNELCRKSPMFCVWSFQDCHRDAFSKFVVKSVRAYQKFTVKSVAWP